MKSPVFTKEIFKNQVFASGVLYSFSSAIHVSALSFAFYIHVKQDRMSIDAIVGQLQ